MLKKLKNKLMIGAMAGVISLFGAGSAHAWDGWADTIATAYAFSGSITTYTTTINAADDIEWFKWTNSATTTGAWRAKLQSPAGKNYDFHIVMFYNNQYYSLGSAPDSGPGGVGYANNNIPAGATVYWQVRGQTGSDFSTTAPYYFAISHT